MTDIAETTPFHWQFNAAPIGGPSEKGKSIMPGLQTTDRAREAWFGIIQEYLECRIEDAPDETCRAFARDLWNQIADFTDE